MKRKRKINGQKIFSFASFIFILICILWYGGRLIYFYTDSKKVLTEESNLFARVLKTNNHDNENFKQIKQNYYFYGTANNNYVEYSNFLWRIVKVNEDNTILLITEHIIGMQAYEVTENTYQESNIMSWLNNKEGNEVSGKFENILNNKETILAKNNICTDSINDLEKITCDQINKDYYLGLLSVQDYIYTGGNKGFIHNERTTYLANQKKDGQIWYITEEGKLDTIANNEISGFKAVITLAPTLELKSGTGTKEDPYRFEEEKKYFGSYVKLGEDQWRVYEENDTTLKLILNEPLKNSVDPKSKEDPNQPLKYLYSKKNYYHNDTTYGTLAYFLNKTYYNSLDYQSIILENTYVNGYYGEDNDFQLKDIYQNTIETKVTVPSISDIILNDELDGYVTNTGLAKDSSLIYIIRSKGQVSTKNVGTENYIVPCISIEKSNLKEGSGTALDPYRMES